MTDAMTCKELVELVTEYFDNALSGHDRLRFERHLASCVGCTRFIEQLRTTMALTGRLEESDLSEDARKVLLQTFRRWRSEGR